MLTQTLLCGATGKLPVREAHRSLGVQGFYWGSVTEAWLTVCLAGL